MLMTLEMGRRSPGWARSPTAPSSSGGSRRRRCASADARPHAAADIEDPDVAPVIGRSAHAGRCPGAVPERSVRRTDLDPQDADDAAIAVEPRQPRRRSVDRLITSTPLADTENAPAPLPVLMRIRSAMGTGVPLTETVGIERCAKRVVSRRKRRCPAGTRVAHALEQHCRVSPSSTPAYPCARAGRGNAGRQEENTGKSESSPAIVCVAATDGPPSDRLGESASPQTWRRTKWSRRGSNHPSSQSHRR